MSDDFNLKDAQNEEEDMLIALTDEDGNELNFVVMDALEMEDLGQYVLVTPADAEIPEDDEDSEQEVLILKVIPGEEEDVFATIEDGDELDAVFAEFQKRWDELEDEE